MGFHEMSTMSGAIGFTDNDMRMNFGNIILDRDVTR